VYDGKSFCTTAAIDVGVKVTQIPLTFCPFCSHSRLLQNSVSEPLQRFANMLLEFLRAQFSRLSRCQAFHPQLSRKKLTIWRRSSTENLTSCMTLSALVSFRHRRSDRFRQELTTHWKPYCVDRSPVFLMITERLSVTTMLRPSLREAIRLTQADLAVMLAAHASRTLHFWCVNPTAGLLVILLFTTVHQ